LINGVQISRDFPDKYNGINWRITFLDDSPSGTANFALSVTPGPTGNLVKLMSGASATINITTLTTGAVNPQCTGTQIVPPDKPLVTGQSYYARVFAVNDIGYSLSQISNSEKPYASPGFPTAITLVVSSETELQAVWSPPSTDGGDPITEYKVEYSTVSTFTPETTSSYSITFLSGGAPFKKKLSALTTGTYYFVRVSAKNGQGYGPTAVSVPSSLNPCRVPDGPSNVVLKVTSSSMLTVAWAAPAFNGGDSITLYKVEWDTSQTFASNAKGSIELDGTKFTSYTILAPTMSNYYVRVSAKNSIGYGVTTVSFPSFATPANEVPGYPHTISAVTGDSSGQIKVTWQRPRIPWHGVPCSGTLASPTDCPPMILGSGIPASDGGLAITEYVVSYNEQQDFSGFDSGDISTTNNFLTIPNLTPGRKYFIRVLARNSQGSGPYCSFTDTNCLSTSITAAQAIAKV
jgi:hypothetical protein